MKDSPKILIIKLSSLGDIIHTLPAFQSLRASFPEGRIDWLVECRLAFLLSAVPGIDHVIPIDTRALRHTLVSRQSWHRLLEPIRRLRSVRYDAAIDFQGLIKTAVIGFGSRARMRIGFAKTLVRERPAQWFYQRKVEKPVVPIHVARLNLLLAMAAGARQSELTACLRAGDADTRTMEGRLLQEQLSDFAIINPGGGWPTKKWQPARYGQLAVRIQNELQMKVVVVTGPGEESLYREIAAECGGRLPVHLDVPFLQLIPLLQRARVVISGDTGPLHLACALRIPVVAIMGPTAPTRNGPWTETDEVVVHYLPCSFCNGRSCPTGNECMDIGVEEVFRAVVRRLEKKH
jgi:lipopolysaccharide heptosyltransferase I